ncbi:MAG: site-specific integrase [Desulfomonile tiedjei]|uniref:Site-specific integrase n=1 Tax=Desulfomonile tiedjei TaxID=2358 RepID=A0A9D6V2G5_9BACT|nr:site-specific integrase [Desulfomonile tiedjei]
MAVKKRGKKRHFKIRIFGKEVGVVTQARLKSEAERIEMAIFTACRAGDYRGLDPVSREVCVRMFQNQGWKLPPDLGTEEKVEEELTLWKGIELCLKYPEIKNTPNRERLEYSFAHLVEKWGKDFPVKSTWIPQIKEYQINRLNDGAAAATVNKEKAALSKMFQVLMELRLVDVNPARLVKNLSEKSGERQVYISHEDFQKILGFLPVWFRPIAQTAYYTGMWRGEVVYLTRKRVNLKKRMIYLGPEDVKEGQWKRVPIHKDLVPILEEVMKVQAIGTDHIFLHNGAPVTHRDQLRWCWDRKSAKAGLDPHPRFHDLRHTWKTNARRSGMHPEIQESILGHSTRQRSVSERYGRISDQELLQAIDLMTFDHGETEIWVASEK